MANLMNRLRKKASFLVVSLRGQPEGKYYQKFIAEDQAGMTPDMTCTLLSQMLAHSRQHVPYYRKLMAGLPADLSRDPEQVLQQLPVLTKEIIRSRFDDLKSDDLPQRKWIYNTSGGSTGEPVRFIQDNDYLAKTGAIKMFFSNLAGCDVGERQVFLWGSERDIVEGSEHLRARMFNWLNNTVYVNAFRMTEAEMREFIELINRRRPRLIVAYTEPIYEMASLAEREQLEVAPQSAIITSAGMLYPFMREKIERVFQCRVYNRYGSREVGDIACERDGIEGLWVAPWGNYIEIVDGQGRRVPDGEEGDILVTNLSNYAMPLIRYRIGDRGVLAPVGQPAGRPYGQVLQSLLGRNVDCFKTSSGTLVYSGYFMTLLFFKDWVEKYQVVQKDLKHILYKVVPAGKPSQADLDEITENTRILFGDDCRVEFEFPNEIPVTGSGKYRYTICELDRPGERK